MRNPFTLPEDALFTNKKLFSMWLPVLIEQGMISIISMVDVSMSVYISETAVAGIALVSPLNALLKQILYALAVGGSVVVSRSIGAQNKQEAGKSAKLLIYILILTGILLNLLFWLGTNPLITWMGGSVEPEVKRYATIFLQLSVCTLPFMSLYYAVTACYRAAGDTTRPMIASVSMTLLNLVIKYWFIYKLNLGVFGAGLSSLVAAAVIGIFVLIQLLRTPHLIIVEKFWRPEWNSRLAASMLTIGIPNSIESGLFQFGLLLLQRLSAGFGTYALSADAIAKAITPLTHVFDTCAGLVLVTVVGQTMGAKRLDQTKLYLRHIMRLEYLITVPINILVVVFSPQLVGLYHVSAETAEIATGILRIYTGFSVLFHPTAFALPYAMRGAGDTKFTMVASITSMFSIRIACAYLFARTFQLGIYGVWLAMALEWVIKSAVFLLRQKSGKWLTADKKTKKAEVSAT